MVASSSFLDGADAALNFGNVLIFAGNIEVGVEAGLDVPAAAFELHVGVDRVDLKATLAVGLEHMFDALVEGRRCAIG